MRIIRIKGSTNPAQGRRRVAKNVHVEDKSSDRAQAGGPSSLYAQDGSIGVAGLTDAGERYFGADAACPHPPVRRQVRRGQLVPGRAHDVGLAA